MKNHDAPIEALEILFKAALESKGGDERQDALRGLGSTRASGRMQRLLDTVFTDEVKPQEICFPMLTLRTNATGSDLLWEWARNRWDDVETKVSSGPGIFGVMVGIMIRGLGSRKHLKEIEEYLEGKDTAKYGKQLAPVLDYIKANALWVERDEEDVRDWLRENGFLD